MSVCLRVCEPKVQCLRMRAFLNAVCYAACICFQAALFFYHFSACFSQSLTLLFLLLLLPFLLLLPEHGAHFWSSVLLTNRNCALICAHKHTYAQACTFRLQAIHSDVACNIQAYKHICLQYVIRPQLPFICSVLALLITLFFFDFYVLCSRCSRCCSLLLSII